MKQTHRPPRSIYPAQNRHMRRRTRVLAGLVAVLCFGGLLARLFTLQMLDPSGYANRAAAQQLRDTTLPAARLVGQAKPRFFTALRTRSAASLTALSGRPTMESWGSPPLKR